MLDSVNLVKNRRNPTRWNKFFACFGATDTPGFCRDHRTRKTPAGNTFPSSLKLLLFNALFVKKFRDKKSKWGSCRSRRTHYSSSKSEKQTPYTKKKSCSSSQNVIFHPDERSHDLSSNRSSLFSSASSRSTCSFSSNSTLETERICGSITASLCPRQRQTRSITKNGNQQQEGTKRVYGQHCNTMNHNPLCILILVCLVALAIWGKAGAIVVCTTACLLVTAPAGGVVDTQTNNVVDYSKEYKKRVIMEGMLDRSRSD